MVVAAVEDRKVKHLASEELQPLGRHSDHDSQQLPGAKMVPFFLLGDGRRRRRLVLSLGDRRQLVLTRVTSGAPPGGGGRPRLSSTCKSASVSMLYFF